MCGRLHNFSKVKFRFGQNHSLTTYREYAKKFQENM